MNSKNEVDTNDFEGMMYTDTREETEKNRGTARSQDRKKRAQIK
jgi:hypothetical protein